LDEPTPSASCDKLERLDGKAGAWILELDDWLGSLNHGRRLAYTLALAGTAVAVGCFYLAGLVDEDVG
jgi:hypothetical protein